MASELRVFLQTIIRSAKRRADTVTLTAWGKERTFAAYDLYDDTFIFEDGIWDHIENKDSVVFVSKAALRPDITVERDKPAGNIMTVSTGNHAVTTIPMLTGKFWDFAALPEEIQGDTLRGYMVCCNCVRDTFEISQREVPTKIVAEMDDWLQSLGCPMEDIVLIDRVSETLDYYSRRGQEWRIKPLAWTLDEMKAALRGSVSRMHSVIKYYHNVKGVHFLSHTNFVEFGKSILENYDEFRHGLFELAGTGQYAHIPNIMLPKFHGHHEVEFFGVLPGIAMTRIVPAILDLYAHVQKPETTPSDTAERFAAIAMDFRNSLAEPDFADETSPQFLETLYRNITGAIYFDEHETMSRAFDDLRTPLPGATYMLDSRFIHNKADARTIAILDSLEHEISHGDRIEYVNVYEIRSNTEEVRLGEGKTREIVYKTAWNPLVSRIIEKRLAQRSTGYGAYTIARAQAFQTLGVSYGRHRLLARKDGAAGDVHYFMRERYPGEPSNNLSRSLFFTRDMHTGKFDTSKESADIVRVLIMIMGTAAAENMILKKYSAETKTIRFNEGKEIVEFGYDVRYGKEMPLHVRLCSVRGTMGWADLSYTEENLANIFDLYMGFFSQMVFDYTEQHTVISPWDIADAFLDGFTAKTREISWNYRNRREHFDNYEPRVFGDYRFVEKWKFALWALEEQRKRLDALAELFYKKFTDLVTESEEAQVY